jgi:hypothetical protein
VSEKDRGTSFTVFLPLIVEIARAPREAELDVAADGAAHLTRAESAPRDIQVRPSRKGRA